MSKDIRQKLYLDIEKHRGRPLLVYVTSKRQGVQAAMATDALPYIIEQLDQLPPESTEVDFLISSYGGDPMVAWRMMSLVRQRVKNVFVLIPQSAYSAATLFALGANEIFMHPNGHLGPVDMQIVAQTENGVTQFSTEDVSAFLEFVRDSLKLTDQEHIRVLFESICKEVSSLGIGFVVRSSKLAVDLGERLLALHMDNDDRGAKLRSMIENMSKNFQSHSYPVTRNEAREAGLPVNDDPDKTLEDLMWKVWLDIEEELKERKPFSIMFEIFNSAEGKKLLAPVPLADAPTPASTPAPTPVPPPASPPLPAVPAPETVPQAPSSPTPPAPALTSANPPADTANSVHPIEFEYKSALIESARLAHSCVTRGKILATRKPDLLIDYNQINTFKGWETT